MEKAADVQINAAEYPQGQGSCDAFGTFGTEIAVKAQPSFITVAAQPYVPTGLSILSGLGGLGAGLELKGYFGLDFGVAIRATPSAQKMIPGVTSKRLADAQKALREACASGQNSAACAAAKRAYRALFQAYNQQNPLPSATGNQTSPDVAGLGAKLGIDYAVCALGGAGTVGNGGAALVMSGGTTLWGCSEAFGIVN